MLSTSGATFFSCAFLSPRGKPFVWLLSGQCFSGLKLSSPQGLPAKMQPEGMAKPKNYFWPPPFFFSILLLLPPLFLFPSPVVRFRVFTKERLQFLD